MFLRLSPDRLLCLTLIALLTGCSQVEEKPTTATPNSAAATSQPQLTAFGDFATAAPAGWIVARTNTPQTAAFFVHIGPNGKTPSGMIKVDVGKPVLPTLQATAETFAGEDGKITPGVTVDGEEGILVETPSVTNARPRVIIACLHGGKLYLIMGSREGEIDVDQAVQDLAANWHWAD